LQFLKKTSNYLAPIIAITVCTITIHAITVCTITIHAITLAAFHPQCSVRSRAGVSQ
jgi:hypothetical protein